MNSCDYCTFDHNMEGAWGEFKVGKDLTYKVIGYATTVRTALSDKGLVSLYYNDDSCRKGLVVKKVGFCPICGRKLKEERDG